MKHLLRPLILLCLPVLLSACENGMLGPQEVSCLETRQTSSDGSSSEKVYNDNKITELRYLWEGNIWDYYTFKYGSDGRISESQYFNVHDNTKQVPDKITYNASDKWVKIRATNTTEDIFSYEAEYDNQNQIRKYTSSTERDGTVTVNYTVTYEWEGGNNTRRLFSSPTQQIVTKYDFDLNRENKRRKEQEKIAFLSSYVRHNKNMYQRWISTNTTDSTTTETVSEYTFQYNEQGYPTQLTYTNITDSGTPTVTETDFYYDCD